MLFVYCNMAWMTIFLHNVSFVNYMDLSGIDKFGKFFRC